MYIITYIYQKLTLISHTRDHSNHITTMNIDFWADLPTGSKLIVKVTIDDHTEIWRMIYAHTTFDYGSCLVPDGKATSPDGNARVYCFEKNEDNEDTDDNSEEDVLSRSFTFRDGRPERGDDPCQIDILSLKKTQEPPMLYVPIPDTFLDYVEAHYPDLDIAHDYMDQGWTTEIGDWLKNAEGKIFKLEWRRIRRNLQRRRVMDQSK